MSVPMSGRSARWFAVSAVVAVLLFGSLLAGTSAAPTAPHVGSVELPTTGSIQISLAEKSLELGQGPAPLNGLHCASVGAGSARCGALPLAGAPTPYYWNNLTSLVGTGPGPRVELAMTYDVSDGYVLLYGGNSTLAFQPSTWSYSNGTWTNLTTSVTGQPPAVLLAEMAYDPSTGHVIFFGGITASSVYSNQTWTYHAKVWTNITATAGTPPSARVIPAMATDTTDNEVVLVGGAAPGIGSLMRDTWTFKDGTWTNVTSSAPISSHLELPSISNDPAAGGVLLTDIAYNESPSGPYYGATFLYHGGVWENLTMYGPRAGPMSLSEAATIGYLPAAAGVFLAQGLAFNSTGTQIETFETWEFSGGIWTNVTDRVGHGPGVGLLFGGAAIPSDSTLLIAGGTWVAGFLPDTWVLSAPPTVTASSSTTVTDIGVPVSFVGTVTGGVDPTHPAWKFGDGTSGTGLSVSHPYAASGNFGATFTASDLIGENATVTVPVVVNTLPTVTGTVSPSSPTAGSAAGLFASVTGGTAPFTYAWTLGDGGIASTAVVTHSYTNAGTYTVSVKITDAVGATANVTFTVTVGSAPSTASAFSYTSGMGLVLLLVIVVLLVVAVVLGILLARKGGGSRPAPTQYAGATSGGPPPGAGGAPPSSP